MAQGFASLDPECGPTRCSSGHTEAAYHIAQQEYTTMHWGLRGEEEEGKKRLAIDVSSGANLKRKKEHMTGICFSTESSIRRPSEQKIKKIQELLTS